MHDHRAAIHDDPLTVVFAFDARLAKTGVAHFVTHARGQGFGLAIGGTRRHDDALKQRGQVLGVKHHEVLGFDVLQRIHDGALQFLDIFFGGGFGHLFYR